MTRKHKYGAKPGWYTKDLQKCTALIDKKKCTYADSLCGAPCQDICKTNAVRFLDLPYVIDRLCTSCGDCVKACRQNAIKLNKNGKYYFHSKLELETARILYHTKSIYLYFNYGSLISWTHHPEKWDFNTRREKPFRNYSTYTPDFEVKCEHGTFWIECKGFNYPGSLTKIKRAVELFPERPLFVKTHNEIMTADEYLKRKKSGG